MKRLFLAALLTFTIFILAACSIPIGDGELIVTSDGIDFIKGDATESMEDESSKEDDTTMEDEENNNNEENDSQDNASTDDETLGDDEVNAENDDTRGLDPLSPANCEKQDHSRIMDELDFDLYIPDCATILNRKFESGQISASFLLEGVHWEETASQYREYFKNTGFDVKESEDFQYNYSRFNFKIDEDYFSTSSVNISEKNDGTEISIEIYNE